MTTAEVVVVVSDGFGVAPVSTVVELVITVSVVVPVTSMSVVLDIVEATESMVVVDVTVDEELEPDAATSSGCTDEQSAPAESSVSVTKTSALFVSRQYSVTPPTDTTPLSIAIFRGVAGSSTCFRNRGGDTELSIAKYSDPVIILPLVPR